MGQSKEFKYELDTKLNEIKLIEATEAAQEIMYTKQQYFKYRNKPNKQLAKVLAESTAKPSIADVMVAKDGDKIESISGKLDLLS